MNNPLLSVIVPVYNTEAYVSRCLDSILNQTYNSIEIIIVDDASEGDIKEIAEEYCKQNSNVRLICHEKNMGLFQARITGLKAAKGEYFAFVDSDDYLSVDFYRIMMKKAFSEQADIVVSDYLEYYSNENCFYSPHGMLQQIDWDLKNEEIIEMLMRQQGLDYSWWVVWNKIYSIRLWKENAEFLKAASSHLIMCEDIAFSVVFFSKATHLANVHNNYYYYCRSDESSTTSKSISYQKYKKIITDFTTAFHIAKEILIQNNQWRSYQKNWEIWLDSISNVWKSRISNDADLKKAQRLQLQDMLDNLPISVHANQFDLSHDFCSHGTKWYGEDWVNEIKKAIADKECKVVSFDIFDTLICRPFLHPTDLFHLLDCYVNQIITCTDYIVFTDIRIRAEALAREVKRAKQPLWEEVSLDEIYTEIANICPEIAAVTEQIKQKEIELEIKYCSTRKFGKELLECAAACQKRIICVSDMYLPESVITSILHSNGISTDYIYLSSEIGLTKSSGNLYDYVMKAEKLTTGSSIVHIGDNWWSDIENAKKKGIIAYHLPKASDIYCGYNPAIYGGNFYKIFNEKKGIYSAFSANEHWGFRCMQAVAANKLFDNPFVFYDRTSDYNADAYTIGYQAIGMNLFATADWLIHSVMEEQYHSLVFMARDGYLPLKAFRKLNEVYKQNIDIHYLNLSRKAIMPLMLTDKTDYYALYNTFGLSTMTPQKFLKILTPVLKPGVLENVEKICKKYGVSHLKTFGTIEGFMSFANTFFAEFFDEQKAEKYRLDMKAYLDHIFKGKSATFDVGYNARCESILKKNYGYDVTAHYIHTNNDRPIGRIRKSGIKIKTLYPHSPFITGIMREQLMSEMTPSCIGYDYSEGTFAPKFEEKYYTNLQTRFVTLTMQKAAIDFVTDMTEIFGDDLKYLAYRHYDACMPLETYLTMPSAADQSIWSGTVFEDDMGIGNDKSLIDFWNQELSRWGGSSSVIIKEIPCINYNALPFIKRWLTILGSDWSEGKRRFYGATENHRIVRAVFRGTYVACRKIYRIVK